MKIEDFQLNIEIKKEMEFVYDGERYTITYGKTDRGSSYIQVGLLYDSGVRYDSYTQMMTCCKIKNAYLREIVQRLNIN